jgi:UDP-glucose 4-epimerase
MKSKRAIVTGGAGFIGSHLVDKLLKNDYDVFVIDNFSSGKAANINSHYTNSKFLFEQTSILSDNINTIFKIFKPDVVFHLAAIPGVNYSVENPKETNDANISGTLNILNACVTYKVKKFIFSSSAAVYGPTENLPTTEEHHTNPKSPYALQKKVGEDYCKLYSNMYNLDTVILRYFNVFGPRQSGDSEYSSAIASFAKNLVSGKRSTVYGDGEQFRDFCHVDNIVNANILASEFGSRLEGEIFNVGCGGRISINQLANIIDPVGPPLYKEQRGGDIKSSQADISKISKKLKYKILVPFKEGLDATLKWYEKNNTI